MIKLPDSESTIGHTLLSLRCSNSECMARFRIGRYQSRDIVVGSLCYCPFCGSSGAMALIDTDVSYWETLAEKYNITPDLLEAIYDQWDPHVHNKFADFVNEIKKEAGLQDA